MKTKSKNDRREANQTETVLRRLVTAPETAHQIYELAESLYSRYGENGDTTTARLSLADIERIGEYLREIETDDKRMKKQFAELAAIESSFHPAKIPIGF